MLCKNPLKYVEGIGIVDSAKAASQGQNYGTAGITRLVPCGQCIGCKIQRGMDWGNRIMLEAENRPGVFITLTYSDENIPWTESEDGYQMTLKKEDPQKWLKKLRKRQENKISYILTGEYGGKTGRPHYHVIMFGMSLTLKETGSGYKWSPEIKETWNLGEHVIAEVCRSTAMYVGLHAVKNRDVDSGVSVPPYMVSSKKEPIGYSSISRINSEGKMWIGDGEKAKLQIAPRPLLMKWEKIGENKEIRKEELRKERMLIGTKFDQKTDVRKRETEEKIMITKDKIRHENEKI